VLVDTGLANALVSDLSESYQRYFSVIELAVLALLRCTAATMSSSGRFESRVATGRLRDRGNS